MGCTGSKPPAASEPVAALVERTSIPNPAVGVAATSKNRTSVRGEGGEAEARFPSAVGAVLAEGQAEAANRQDGTNDFSSAVSITSPSASRSSIHNLPSSSDSSAVPVAVAVTKKKLKKPKVSTGRMMKEGQNVKNWKERFFVLREGTLYYYNREVPPKTNKGETELGHLDLKVRTHVYTNWDFVLTELCSNTQLKLYSKKKGICSDGALK